MQAQAEDRSIGFPGAEVAGGCELSDMSAGTLTQVLCKSSMLS